MSKNLNSKIIKVEMQSALEHLGAAIHSSGISYDDIAYSAGVSTGNLHKYLNGTTIMPFDRFLAITDTIGVDWMYIALGDNSGKCFKPNLSKGYDALAELKNIKMWIENESDSISAEERTRYLNYVLEIGLLLNKKPC